MSPMSTELALSQPVSEQDDGETEVYYQLQHLQYLSHKLLDIHQLEKSDLDDIYGPSGNHLEETLNEVKALLDEQGSERGVPFWSEGVRDDGMPILHHAAKFCGTCQLEAEMEGEGEDEF